MCMTLSARKIPPFLIDLLGYPVRHKNTNFNYYLAHCSVLDGDIHGISKTVERKRLRL